MKSRYLSPECNLIKIEIKRTMVMTSPPPGGGEGGGGHESYSSVFSPSLSDGFDKFFLP
jgi:hypothetical protein